MKNNNPKIIAETFWREMDDVNQWTRARVENQIDQTVRWFIIQTRTNQTSHSHQILDSKHTDIQINTFQDECNMAFRPAFPLDTLMIYDEFVASVCGVELPALLSADSNFFALFEILVRWFKFVPKDVNRKILILHSAGLSMREIGEIIGESRLTTSRRHTRALEKIVWNLNHQNI